MIKSQDDLNTCNDGHRSSSVLLETIEKCEKLENKYIMWRAIAIGVFVGSLLSPYVTEFIKGLIK